MPGQPTWFPRIPDLLTELEKPSAPPFLDRAAIEVLFGLKRRQAIDLMKQLRRYALGKAFVVDRSELLRFLRKRRTPGRHAIERQQRVLDSLADLRLTAQSRPALAIPIRGVTQAVYQKSMARLPAGIELVPGRLTITFTESNALLLKLFELAQAIQNDLETFADAAGPSDPEEEVRNDA
jgi:hypothetical protein